MAYITFIENDSYKLKQFLDERKWNYEIDPLNGFIGIEVKKASDLFIIGIEYGQYLLK